METNSLIFKELRAEDSEEFLDMMLDTQHMKFSKKFDNEEQCRRYIASLSNQWQTLGYGCWLALEKSTNSVVGWGGIIVDEEDPGWGPELIYYIVPDKCGLGYASELARTAVAYGLNTLRLPKIAAFAHPENEASNRVLEKSEFAYSNYIQSMNRNYYEIKSNDYTSC